MLEVNGDGLGCSIPLDVGAGGLRQEPDREHRPAGGDLRSDIHRDRRAVQEQNLAADGHLDDTVSLDHGDLLRSSVPDDVGVRDSNGVRREPESIYPIPFLPRNARLLEYFFQESDTYVFLVRIWDSQF